MNLLQIRVNFPKKDDENDVVKEIAPLDQLFSGIWERKSRRRRKKLKDLLKFGWIFFGIFYWADASKTLTLYRLASSTYLLMYLCS